MKSVSYSYLCHAPFVGVGDWVGKEVGDGTTTPGFIMLGWNKEFSRKIILKNSSF